MVTEAGLALFPAEPGRKESTGTKYVPWKAVTTLKYLEHSTNPEILLDSKKANQQKHHQMEGGVNLH